MGVVFENGVDVGLLVRSAVGVGVGSGAWYVQAFTRALDNGGVPSSEDGCVLIICRVADGVAVEQAASTSTANPRMLWIRGDMILLPRNSSTLLTDAAEALTLLITPPGHTSGPSYVQMH